MASNSLVGSTPLSTNANIGNISPPAEPTSPTTKARSLRNISTVVPPKLAHAKSFSHPPSITPRKLPLQPFQQQQQEQQQEQQQQQPTPPPRSRTMTKTPHTPSSLPRRHYPVALPSPAESISNNVKNGSSDNICASSEGPIFHDHLGNTGSTSANSCSRSNCSDVSDKENSPIEYSPVLENVKSSLARNRLRKNNSRSDSLQSILSSVSRDRGSDCATGRGVSSSIASNKRVNRREVIVEEKNEPKGNKRYKIDLAPRIAMSASQMLKEKSKSTAARQNFGATSTQQQKQHRTQKCLQEALEIMRSNSHDDSIDRGCNVSSTSSNVSSLDDPFFQRLNAKLDIFKSRRKFVNRGKLSSEGDSDAGSSRGGSKTGGNASIWLSSSMAKKSDTGSLTFSVSPIAKGPSTIVGSYIGSLQLDSKGNEVQKDTLNIPDAGAQSTNIQHDTSPAQTIESQPTVGSYIGTIGSVGSEQAKTEINERLRESNVLHQQKSTTRAQENGPCYTNTVTMLPTLEEVVDFSTTSEHNKENDQSRVNASPTTIATKQSKTFPLKSIDDRHCIQQVPSDMTPDNGFDKSRESKDTLSPLPQRHSSAGTSPHTPQDRSPIGSPMPSAANSLAPSYATSMATSAATGTTGTSETTNLFDMLRNTFNHDSGEDSSEGDSSCENGTVEDVRENKKSAGFVATRRTLSRPPLSPIPPCDKSVSHLPKAGQRTKPTLGMTPKKTPNPSPKIIRGTPSRTPCSNVSSTRILDSSTVASNTPSSRCQSLEYSFLANVLVATNILATPPTKPDELVDSSSSKEKYSADDTASRDSAKDASVRSKDTHPSTNIKSSNQELNYASIGATSSILCTKPKPRCVDAATMALDAEITTSPLSDQPTHNSDQGSEPSPKHQCTPNLADNGQASSRKHQKPQSSAAIALPTPPRDILSIASALDDASSFDSSQSSNEANKSSMSRQEEQLIKLAERVKRLESQMPNDGTLNVGSGTLDAYLNDDGGEIEYSSQTMESFLLSCEFEAGITPKKRTSQGHRETTKLRERVKWLEKVLGFGRGANHVYQDEIHHLKEKLSILECRLEEEMGLKDEANEKVMVLTSEFEAAQEVYKTTKDSLQQKVNCLESELESEKVNKLKVKDLEQRMTSISSQLHEEKKKAAEHAATAKAKDDGLKDLQRSNKELLLKQKLFEKELVSCAADNDKMRGRLVSLATECNTKEQTLSTALNQLKSLSETYYRTEQSLKSEQVDRQALQMSLDDMSHQMLLLTKRLNELDNENDCLRNKVRRQRLEKERSMAFRRGARGG